MIPPRSLSRDGSEIGVSSRVEACRKRWRMNRANQKTPIEPVVGSSVARDVEPCNDTSRSSGAIEAKAPGLDEVGIT